MKTTTSFLATILLSLSCLAHATAQMRPKIPVPEIHRKTVLDDQGLQQWPEHDVECPHCKGAKIRTCDRCAEAEFDNCAACKDKKKAPCRVCAGTGKLFDPLEHMICPYCDGTLWHPCRLCSGKGSYPVKGSGDTEMKCGGCKSAGSHKCTACRGQHHIPVVRIGRDKVTEASAEDLEEAKERLQETLSELEKLKITSNESKTTKDIAKTVRKATRLLPALKHMQRLMDTAVAALRKGAQYTAYPEWMLAEFAHFQDRSIYLLRHQILLIDMCLERAKHNERVLEELKNKKD